jgi:hypothetical protein
MATEPPLPQLAMDVPSLEMDMAFTPSYSTSGPNSPDFSSLKTSQQTILLAAAAHENKSLPLLENCSDVIAFIFDFSLYLAILPRHLKSIREIEESSLPIAIVFTLFGMNFTAVIPHGFLSNTLKHYCLILMSHTLAVASVLPDTNTFPSWLNVSRHNTSFW